MFSFSKKETVAISGLGGAENIQSITIRTMQNDLKEAKGNFVPKKEEKIILDNSTLGKKIPLNPTNLPDAPAPFVSSAATKKFSVSAASPVINSEKNNPFKQNSNIAINPDSLLDFSGQENVAQNHLNSSPALSSDKFPEYPPKKSFENAPALPKIPEIPKNNLLEKSDSALTLNNQKNQLPPSPGPAKSSRAFHKVFFIVISLILTAGAALGIYFAIPFIKTFFKKEPIQRTETENQPVERPVFEPEIIKNEYKLLELQNVYDFNLESDDLSFYYAIKSKINSKEINPNTGIYDLQISLDGKFPDSEFILNDISEDFPPSVLSKIGNKYNLIAYEESKEIRLGLILEIIDEKEIVVVLRQWENSIVQDLKNLFIKGMEEATTLDTEEEKPATGLNTFDTTIFKDIEIRYQNINSPSTALDYAIVDNMLIITTSRDSMFDTIDIIKAEEEQLPSNDLLETE
ncbi:MAG: hypothetical protein V1698_01875 [bacterium]